MACFWIFTAELSTEHSDYEQSHEHHEGHEEEKNWIISGGYNETDISSLYITAVYYTVTTISTVGYGDISGNNDVERIICIILMITGVFFFSISSGSFTNIISNYEQLNAKT